MPADAGLSSRVQGPTDRTIDRIVVAVSVLALALRIAGAQGSLWLDEAWSATLAHDVGTPAGVIVGINHDNNHHLNSLWLLAVGIDAPSWLMRGLSIASGTLAVPVAAALARPRGAIAAVVTALLFAVSPMLVTLGSEARGYAPMTLALLVPMLFVDRTLAGDRRYRRPTTLALCFALGALSQLTMVFGVIALTGWAFLSWWRQASLGEAARRSLRLFAGPLAALAGVIGTIALAAWASPGGFRFGAYDPFAAMLFLHAVVEMTGYTIGWPLVTIVLPLAALALVVLAPRLGATRTAFYVLAIVAFPATLAVLHAGNTGHPRYYLLVALALLLLLGEVLGKALERSGANRWIAAAALATIVLGSVAQDIDLAINRRGDPGGAVRTLASVSPGGATVLLDRPFSRATLTVAAAQQHYPLRLLDRGCAANAFVFVDRYKGEILPPSIDRCGGRYHAIAGSLARGLSGTHWTLYARTA